MTIDSRTDDELFSAVKLNDKKAFNTLYDRYWALVYKRAFSYLHDREACTEIVNDIFLNIWIKRDVLNILTFENYLTAAARYRVYNFLKAQKKSELIYIEDYQQFSNAPMEKDRNETNTDTSDIQYRINVLLNELPKRCKEIFLLSRVTQLTNTEIAYKLSISKRTVENQLSVAVKYLKSRFGRFTIFYLLLSFVAYLLQGNLPTP